MLLLHLCVPPSFTQNPSNSGRRLLWSCFTLLSGVGLSTCILLSLQTRVGHTFGSLRFLLMVVEQCSAATNHLITNAVFNISSDLIILSIPMPLLFRVRLPMKNKVVLVSVFLIGAFTYVAIMPVCMLVADRLQYCCSCS
jgi:hypothetical protein